MSADDRRVDTAAAMYAHAGELAATKHPHHGAPGTQGLVWKGDPTCYGRLRTAYVRRRVLHQWPAKLRWVPVGVLCEKCGAWWPGPLATVGDA